MVGFLRWSNFDAAQAAGVDQARDRRKYCAVGLSGGGQGKRRLARGVRHRQKPRRDGWSLSSSRGEPAQLTLPPPAGALHPGRASRLAMTFLSIRSGRMGRRARNRGAPRNICADCRKAPTPDRDRATAHRFVADLRFQQSVMAGLPPGSSGFTLREASERADAHTADAARNRSVTIPADGPATSGGATG